MRNLTDVILSHFPTFLAVLTLALVLGFGFGGFAAVADRPSPEFQSATISTDGSICAIVFANQGSGVAHLSQITLSYASASVVVSFSSSFLVPPNHATEYTCRTGTKTQFVPAVSAISGLQYNLTARFEDGAIATFTSTFA